MATPLIGELIWYRRNGTITLGVFAPRPVRTTLGAKVVNKPVRCSNLILPWVNPSQIKSVLYRHPIQIQESGNELTVGPVFAILAGGSGDDFRGSRGNFRDIQQCARTCNQFVYVLPAGSVNERRGVWTGYVRLGYQRWLGLPCPIPEAIYNRVPLRNLERGIPVTTAKDSISRLGIPMFNPDYFNKAVIYDIVERADLAQFVPETLSELTRDGLRSMLFRHASVYLKPSGGSIGHGIIRIDNQGKHYTLSVLKEGTCKTYTVSPFPKLWDLVRTVRLPGRYVVQAAKPLLEWEGRPCDLRILTQKQANGWEITGIGVRVAGPQTITTHVPNGGRIIAVNRLLERNFADKADIVQATLERMVLACAKAIDDYYRGALGEMSMDIGLDEKGNPWFFEANSKPMKFDEQEIRARSLVGVLNCLEVFRARKRDWRSSS